MQTFLPYPDFAAAAAVLDPRRLGKQRVECLQILRAIWCPAYGWQYHPAVNMWRQHPRALATYGLTVCAEWTRRGYRDNGTAAELAAFATTPQPPPPWITPALCASHRSNLLRKDYTYYSKFGWTEPNNLPYIWPI